MTHPILDHDLITQRYFQDALRCPMRLSWLRLQGSSSSRAEIAERRTTMDRSSAPPLPLY
jgi:hypothetical protein